MELNGDLERGLVRIYAGPRERFVAERNALARELKTKDDEQAGWVLRLPKPSLLAWAVNRLRSESRDVFDQLVTSGEALREALGHGDPTAAMSARRRAVDRALEQIDQIWQADGRELTVAQRRTLASTLEALSVGNQDDAAVARGLRGLLSRDLRPPGLESLIGLSVAAKGATAGKTGSRGGSRKSRSRSSNQETRETAAGADKKKALAAARARLTRSKKALAKLEAEGEQARDRVVEVQNLLAEVRAARAELRGRIQRLQGEVRRAEREALRLESGLN